MEMDRKQKTNIERVVLTGGPCSGKTDILNAMAMEFPGKIVAVPEISECLLSSGLFPVPHSPTEKRDVTYSDLWQSKFQEGIANQQFLSEDVWRLRAEEIGAGVLLCDRGGGDGRAYGKWDSMESFSQKMFKISAEKMWNRYCLIIHLQSLASFDEAEFNLLRRKNSNRFEDSKKTLSLEIATLDAWEGHPNRIIINGVKNFSDKIKTVSHLLNEVIDKV